MCEHLIEFDTALKEGGHVEIFRGQVYSLNCREWVYYNVAFDPKEIRAKFKLPGFVQLYVNDDARTEAEAGFVCTRCNDAVIGQICN